MEILEDTRQQAGKHTLKADWFKRNGVYVNRCALPYGDYMAMPDDFDLMLEIYDLSGHYRLGKNIPPKKRHSISDALKNLYCVSVDTKQDMQEVYSNVILDHNRFRAECELGGDKLWILVEDDSVESLEGVPAWRNPRTDIYFRNKKLGRKVCGKPPVGSKSLHKTMQTISERYGVHWAFCSKQDAGKTIIDILTREGGA